MPFEGAPHRRTWMVFGASGEFWGRRWLPAAQNNLAELALTIARYEPVTMLVRSRELGHVRGLVGDKVELVTAEMDDIWTRDIAPIFIQRTLGERNQSQQAALNLNFNGWGEQQLHRYDKNVASEIAELAHVREINAPLVVDGCGIDVDGAGTAMITESSVLTPKRNPAMNRIKAEQLLAPYLGVKKIIWLAGERGDYFLGSRIGRYARFVGPGHVVVSVTNSKNSPHYELLQRHLKLLRTARDAQGRQLTIDTIPLPNRVRPRFNNGNFASGYLGFYLCNGALIMPRYGDPSADENAKQQLALLFPGRAIEMLNADALAARGGSIRCATQPEPK
ncbi:agmatine deiminase family protein [Vibrio sp. SM6]|uniref:Agmatine deiminase family protein n=2 Tax=Vibrio agarilyticus TaxID=2726741 RepID=A0A7X8TS23_9VIBR|nr:agmatine deiminase family protein [Vibrio agarilyticus]